MTQEVKVMLQLTLDVDATLSKEDIKRRIEKVMLENGNFSYPDMDSVMVDFIEIREEAEIYKTERDSVKEYNKKYHIDTKRQTKIEFDENRS
jgi:hypothetical protein